MNRRCDAVCGWSEHSLYSKAKDNNIRFRIPCSGQTFQIPLFHTLADALLEHEKPRIATTEAFSSQLTSLRCYFDPSKALA